MFAMDSTLLHPSCVKCGRAQPALRELAADIPLDGSLLAMACDPCWALVQDYVEWNESTLFDAFYRAAPGPDPEPEELGPPFPVDLSWTSQSGGIMEQWRATQASAPASARFSHHPEQPPTSTRRSPVRLRIVMPQQEQS